MAVQNLNNCVKMNHQFMHYFGMVVPNSNNYFKAPRQDELLFLLTLWNGDSLKEYVDL